MHVYPYDDFYRPLPVPDARELAGRVTHLVFVGGRLVQTWHEDAADTEWAGYVEPPATPAPPPPPPPPPVHVQVLDWLAEVCGGRAAVEALDATALDNASTRLPVGIDRRASERLTATAELLDTVAERWFDDETSYAFRHALLMLWDEVPDQVQRPRTPAHLAGGICWAVGRANGLFHPTGSRRVGTVQDTLALTGTLSGPGNEVAAALRGFRGHRPERWRRPAEVPDLLVLGRPELLVGATRERLVRLRERARAAAVS